MTIGILGAGSVGTTLAAGFGARGHTVRLGTRSPSAPRHRAYASESGFAVGPYAEAARGADMVVVATAWEGTEEAVREAAPGIAGGTLVLDATNPLDFSTGMPMIAVADSAGERVQAWLPEAHVVKAFASVGAGHMVDPDFPGGPPSMFIAGDDAGAKARAGEILRAFGWAVADLGGIEASRCVEAMAAAWIRLAILGGSRDLAFHILRRP